MLDNASMSMATGHGITESYADMLRQQVDEARRMEREGDEEQQILAWEAVSVVGEAIVRHPDPAIDAEMREAAARRTVDALFNAENPTRANELRKEFKV